MTVISHRHTGGFPGTIVIFEQVWSSTGYLAIWTAPKPENLPDKPRQRASAKKQGIISGRRRRTRPATGIPVGRPILQRV
jgi:hypothetical protein